MFRQFEFYEPTSNYDRYNQNIYIELKVLRQTGASSRSPETGVGFESTAFGLVLQTPTN